MEPSEVAAEFGWPVQFSRYQGGDEVYVAERGAGPRARVVAGDRIVFDGFLAEPEFTGGLVVVPDLLGDRLTLGAGPGGAPRVVVIEWSTGRILSDSFAGSPLSREGWDGRTLPPASVVERSDLIPIAPHSFAPPQHGTEYIANQLSYLPAYIQSDLRDSGLTVTIHGAESIGHLPEFAAEGFLPEFLTPNFGDGLRTYGMIRSIGLSFPPSAPGIVVGEGDTQWAIYETGHWYRERVLSGSSWSRFVEIANSSGPPNGFYSDPREWFARNFQDYFLALPIPQPVFSFFQEEVGERGVR